MIDAVSGKGLAATPEVRRAVGHEFLRFREPQAGFAYGLINVTCHNECKYEAVFGAFMRTFVRRGVLDRYSAAPRKRRRRFRGVLSRLFLHTGDGRACAGR